MFVRVINSLIYGNVFQKFAYCRYKKRCNDPHHCAIATGVLTGHKHIGCNTGAYLLRNMATPPPGVGEYVLIQFGGGVASKGKSKNVKEKGRRRKGKGK
jgi:hypothetical protein